jgi:SAM-dependent methyltransferase
VSEDTFLFACPTCRGELEANTPDEWRCPADGHRYPRLDGIWCLLPPDRLAYFRQFMAEYDTVREAESRGSRDPAYYRALPFQDLSGRHPGDWRIRAASFRSFLDREVGPMEKQAGRPLAVLDLGAGSGWLSYHLARRSHRVAAIDLQTGGMDGLGAHVHYDVAFTPVQAEYDHLPFAPGQFDLVVYNASFHYSTDYLQALSETMRVLTPGGKVVILDTPVYSDRRSGEQMVREREARFLSDHGFPSNAIPCENFLTYERLDELARKTGLAWRIIRPFYGLRWALRPWRARLRGHREPASFMVIAGERTQP